MCSFLFVYAFTNRSIHQSISQSVNQSLSHSVTQSLNHPNLYIISSSRLYLSPTRLQPHNHLKSCSQSCNHYRSGSCKPSFEGNHKRYSRLCANLPFTVTLNPFHPEEDSIRHTYYLRLHSFTLVSSAIHYFIIVQTIRFLGDLLRLRTKCTISIA